MAHKAINQESWPEYLRLEMKHAKNRLLNRGNCKMEISSERNTFRSNAGTMFNNLPTNIRQEQNAHTFNLLTKNDFKDKALARPL